MDPRHVERGWASGTELIVVIAAVLLIAVTVGVVRLAVPVPVRTDEAGLAREAADHIRTVLATGDLSAPPGGTRVIALQCDPGSGEPSLDLDLTSPADAPPVADTLAARLRTSGWETTESPSGLNSYQKQFGSWSAGLGFENGSLDDGSLTAHLSVHGDMAADCPTFSKELRSLASPRGRPAHPG